MSAESHSRHPPLLQLHQVSLSYGPSKVLDGATFSLSPGELTVVLGPNGAGKSILLKMASGELSPQAGHVQFGSRALRDWSLQQKACHMAVMSQQTLLNFAYRVDEVVMLGRTPHSTGVELDRQIVSEALAAADVSYLKEKLYTQLSGGEKQRVQLARVLAQGWRMEGQPARLFVLDEPTSALDFAHQKQVMTLLRDKARSGDAVLMALHDLNLAATYADKVVLICCGRVRACGSAEEVFEPGLLKEVFRLDFYRVIHPDTGQPLLVF